MVFVGLLEFLFLFLFLVLVLCLFLDGTGGFAILESTNPAALADYALDWNGLVKMEITAIMDDDTIGGVLGKKFG